ncbi:hypothetical protein COOONC_01755 [Cooperia oncophora]
MTFEEYARQALVRHPDLVDVIKEQVRNDERAKQLVDCVEEEWRRFLVVHCLRLLFGPLIEYLLISDRVEFLKEHGHNAVVVPLFDPKDLS